VHVDNSIAVIDIVGEEVISFAPPVHCLDLQKHDPFLSDLGVCFYEIGTVV